MEITEGGERQARVEWHENEKGRNEGNEGWTRKEGKTGEKQRKVVEEDAFSPSRML